MGRKTILRREGDQINRALAEGIKTRNNNTRPIIEMNSYASQAALQGVMATGTGQIQRYYDVNLNQVKHFPRTACGLAALAGECERYLQAYNANKKYL